jgi:hypothetical protein
MPNDKGHECSLERDFEERGSGGRGGYGDWLGLDGGFQELLEDTARAVHAWQVVFGRIDGKVESFCVSSVFP